MPDEENALLVAARDETLCNLRAAGLMVYGHESGKFFLSVSTVQRVLRRNALQTPYEAPKRKRPLKPDIRELMTGPGKIMSLGARMEHLEEIYLRYKRAHRKSKTLILNEFCNHRKHAIRLLNFCSEEKNCPEGNQRIYKKWGIFFI